MAVLAEGISVVVKRSVLDQKYPGGWESFAAATPNSTLCADPHLARVGFMAPTDVEAFVRELERHEIMYLDNGAARDIAVVDQQRGPMTKCDWLDFLHMELPGIAEGRVAACRLAGDSTQVLATPESWTFAGSLSQTFGFSPTGEESKGLRFLRREGGVDVDLSALTGREVYVGRTARTRRQE